MKFSSLFLSLILVLSLTACGGGGSTNAPATNNPPALPPPQVVEEPWLALIEEDPTTKSEGRLQDIYAGAANARYHGSTGFAEITSESVHEYFKILFGNPVYPIYRLGYTTDRIFGRDWDKITENIHPSGCYVDGSFDVTARVNGNKAIVAIQYDDCLESNFLWGPINGSGALFIENRSDEVWLSDRYNFTQFYNSISTSYYNREMEITGFYHLAFKAPESEDKGFKHREFLLFTYPDTGEQFIKYSDGEYVSLPNDVKSDLATGGLMIDSLGKVNFSINQPATNFIEPYRTTILSGRNDSQARLNYLGGAVQLLLDSDGDGVFEEGQYFLSALHLLANDFIENPVVPITQMNRPPRIIWPIWVWGFNDDEPVEFQLDYVDYDTPEENLQITGHWVINYEPLADFHELTLPADRTSVGDTITFYFEIFDGTHTVRSNTVEFEIYESY